jgi:hypothetical protein
MIISIQNSKSFFQKSYANKILLPAGCANKIQNETARMPPIDVIRA